ncbi:hypothetical protein H9P43_001609 [Blastocladiella emersonii ATCC 22665]|nr:hypothetical protein H9P43_001609 [Blastocladiella emersonii ATCC 22665]
MIRTLALRARVAEPLQQAATGFSLQSAPAVAKRVAATHLVMSRWGLEHMSHDLQGREEIPDKVKGEIRGRIAEANAALSKSLPAVELLPSEHAFLHSDLNATPVEELAKMAGRWESFGVLTWSLGMQPKIPAYYNTFDMQGALQSTGIVPANVKTIEDFLARSHVVRPEAELAAALNSAEAWYWRARAQVLLSLKEALEDPSCDSSDANKIPRAVRDMAKKIDVSIMYAASRSLEDGLISEAVGDDFGIPSRVEGADDSAPAWKRYADGTPEEWAGMRLIAENRMAAFGWLMAGREWDISRDEIAFVNHMSSIWQPENAN